MLLDRDSSRLDRGQGIQPRRPLANLLIRDNAGGVFGLAGRGRQSSQFQELLGEITQAMAALKSARQTVAPSVPGGVDFSTAMRQQDGRVCVVKQEEVQALDREQVLECTHAEEEKCHNTYLTLFSPVQEERCDETFEKKCQITFRPEAAEDTVRSCLTPLVKECSGAGPQECRTEQVCWCWCWCEGGGDGGMVCWWWSGVK